MAHRDLRKASRDAGYLHGLGGTDRRQEFFTKHVGADYDDGYERAVCEVREQREHPVREIVRQAVDLRAIGGSVEEAASLIMQLAEYILEQEEND